MALTTARLVAQIREEWSNFRIAMLVLGIESSCDETGVALYHAQRGLLANLLHSQFDIHAPFGGVVPELACRDHICKITPLVRRALAEGGAQLQDIDGVAYTAGPGLKGALLVGAAFGRTLAWSLGVPAIAVHHMEAHLLAPLMEGNRPPLPFIALLVSGGHTQLVKVVAVGAYEMLGESLDDAAGEAFDKVAKMLGLGYPGGPRIAALAEKGDPQRFHFPRPMTDRPGLDFSFSGLKTFALNTVSAHRPLHDQDRADIARAFEEAVVDSLLIKCRRALQGEGVSHLVIAGGVSANLRLRQRLETQLPAKIHYAPPALCVDNGAMIAYAGWQRLAAGHSEPLSIHTQARWPLTDLPPIDPA